MTFKNKAILAGCTVGFSVVLAIVSLVSIFAVSSVSDKNKTNVKITYKSTLVSATYSFCYKNADEENYTYLNKDVSIASKAEDGPTWTTDSISNTEIHLSKNSPYFIMCWAFKNTGNVPISVAYSSSNVKVTGVSRTFKAYQASSTIAWTPENMDDDSITVSMTGESGGWYYSRGISSGTIRYYFIKITMSSKYTSVNYTEDFSWTLSRSSS